MQSSTYTSIKNKCNVQALEKLSTKQSALKISNALCIQNLMMKNSMFVPSKLQPIGFDKLLKINHNLQLIKYKKQIQPHKGKSCTSSVGKSMSSFLNETNDFKQLKHKRNVSAVWQIKKLNKQRQKKAERAQKNNPNASFYMKKLDNPLFYELKMEIKKVQSNAKPLDKFFKNKYKNKNYISFQKQKQKQRQDQGQQGKLPIQKTLENQPNQAKQLVKSTQISRRFITAEKFSMPVKPTPHKQRYIKSTLVSYSSKTNVNKTKQIVNIDPDLQHVKNIISQSQLHLHQVTQQNIELIKPQLYAVTNYQQNKQQLNTKSANYITVCHVNHTNQVLTPLIMKQSNKRVQIASITKIMTCLLVLKIAQFFNLDIKTQKILVSQKASKMPGTSAGLAYSDILTVYQLLHALMLPSGNDAAVALADWGGKNIRKYCALAQKYSTSKTIDAKSMNLITDYTVQKKSYQKLFIYHMNKAANLLKLRNTKFANSHGLMNQKAYSSSLDVAVLTCIAMKNQVFAEVVRNKFFQCKVFNRTYSQSTVKSWRNTNRLLNTEGFVGVKTGVTPSAGPCLSSMYSLNQKQSIVIVVLKTKSMDARFNQSLQLLKQSLNKLGLVGIDYLANKMAEDDQSTAISMQNYKGEEANLVQDQMEATSDREVQEDDQFQQ